MRKFVKKLSLIILATCFMLASLDKALANPLSFCESTTEVDQRCNALSKDECQNMLKQCQDYFQEKSDKIASDISKTASEKKSLQNEISVLNSRINKINSEIYQGNLMIKNINIQIGETEESIDKTVSDIDKAKNRLKDILKTIYKEDQKSVIEILIAEEDISNFFNNIMNLEMINAKNKELLDEIKSLKTNLEDQKEDLGLDKNDLENVVKIQTIKKAESNQIKQEQEYYLKLTKEEYNKQVKEKEVTDQKASEIAARIFELAGNIEGDITFGQAYEIAKDVEKMVGVRPALLLAIITQESALGRNVGKCYVPKSKAENANKRIMAPGSPYSYRDDVSVFLQITAEVGRDPYNTPVSCPMSYGWGGAMGPAQFIPSTWQMFRTRLENLKGSPADPWNIRDAFLAAGLYLSTYGASSQTYEGEFNSILSYFAGPGWYKSSKRNIYKRDYGYPVMNKVEQYERDIAKIK
jgi:membrane-bound lytic murein transglycosylase B